MDMDMYGLPRYKIRKEGGRVLLAAGQGTVGKVRWSKVGE